MPGQSSYAWPSDPQSNVPSNAQELALRKLDFQPPPLFGDEVTSRTSQDGSRYTAPAILGLNALSFEASLHDLLSDPDRQDTILSLQGETARSFLDTLQNANRCPLIHGTHFAERSYRS
jgi:hypothetical protein